MSGTNATAHSCPTCGMAITSFVSLPGLADCVKLWEESPKGMKALRKLKDDASRLKTLRSLAGGTTCSPEPEDPESEDNDMDLDSQDALEKWKQPLMAWAAIRLQDREIGTVNAHLLTVFEMVSLMRTLNASVSEAEFTAQDVNDLWDLWNTALDQAQVAAVDPASQRRRRRIGMEKIPTPEEQALRTNYRNSLEDLCVALEAEYQSVVFASEDQW